MSLQFRAVIAAGIFECVRRELASTWDQPQSANAVESQPVTDGTEEHQQKEIGT